MHVLLARRGWTECRPPDVRRRHRPCWGLREKSKTWLNTYLKGKIGDMVVPKELIGVVLMVAGEYTKLDKEPYTKRILIKVMCYFDVREVCTPHDPGMERKRTSKISSTYR